MEFVDKYNIKITGILHIGANDCEENDLYLKHVSKEHILWIEAIPDIVEKMKDKVNIISAVVSDVDDKEVEFHISSNEGKSSSLLQLGEHAQIHPRIRYTETIKLRTTTLEKIYEQHKIERSNFNFLIMDIQGAELLALRGAKDILNSFDVVWTEFSLTEIYQGCCKLEDLDTHLSQFGFHRVETEFGCPNKYGDALYIKNIKNTNFLINDKIWKQVWIKYENNHYRITEFSKYNKKIYSQNNEDGVLEEIIRRIVPKYKFAIEFGAWDGIHLSNIHYLKQQGWNCLSLEGDRSKIRNDVKHEFVTSENINDVFSKYNVPSDFDLLSIDIDSHDYWVWKGLSEKGLRKFQPGIVIIETHPGLDNEFALSILPHEKAEGGYFGANLRAFYRLAEQKGYKFVTTVMWNAIFVRKDLFPLLNIQEISEEECIEKYFRPEQYWYENRDMLNKTWIVL